MNKDSILEILKESKQELAKYKISKLGLFGSFARDEQNDASDVDILIEFNQGSDTTMFDVIEIEELLSSKINRKVDLALKTKLKPHISKHILNEVLYL